MNDFQGETIIALLKASLKEFYPFLRFLLRSLRDSYHVQGYINGFLLMCKAFLRGSYPIGNVRLL